MRNLIVSIILFAGLLVVWRLFAGLIFFLPLYAVSPIMEAESQISEIRLRLESELYQIRHQNPPVLPGYEWCYSIPNRFWSTPEEIDCAYGKGEISEGERILYLQYAFTDYNKLPKKFQSNEPWDGTMVLLEVKETVENSEKFCKFDIGVRRELMKYYPHASSCAIR